MLTTRVAAIANHIQQPSLKQKRSLENNTIYKKTQQNPNQKNNIYENFHKIS